MSESVDINSILISRFDDSIMRMMLTALLSKLNTEEFAVS